MDIETKIEISTLAFFNNLDESILQLNSYLEKDGYEFIKITINELETIYYSLFGLPKQFQITQYMSYTDLGYTISKEFNDAVRTSRSFIDNIRLLQNGYLMGLKKINSFEQNITCGKILTNEWQDVYVDMQKYLDNLIIQLKLFKNGDLSCPYYFQFDSTNNEMMGVLNNPQKKSYGKLYNIESVELANLITQLSSLKIIKNEMTELALANFKLSYEIDDFKTKFITLMTCMESLFNLGKDQITHTVSRHFSVIFSSNIDEFQINYKRMKTLYGVRSSIIHGSKEKENIEQATDELYDKVRFAIKYVMPLITTKEIFFANLNAKGF